MTHSPRLIHFLAALLALGAGAAAAASTSLTVHNQTGRTLSVSRPWNPWRPEPFDPPLDLHGTRQWLKPGAVGTYCFLVPGRDLESSLVIRSLPVDGIIEFEGVRIQTLDPGPEVIDDELPAEPWAPA